MEQPVRGEVLAADFALQLAGLVARNVLDDWAWHSFGFKQRPRRGRFFDRFVDPEVLAEERFLIQEFFLILLRRVSRAVAVLLPEPQNIAIFARVLELLVDGNRPTDDTWRGFSFTSREAALQFLSGGVEIYGESPAAEEGAIFIRRMTPVARKKSRPIWMVGIAQLLMSGQSPVTNIYQPLSDFLKTQAIIGKVPLRDSSYLGLSERFFGHRARD